MLILDRIETDPYFNIAAEEYLLKEFQEEIFMLWQNEASIIIGKHQNALAEINLEFVNTNNIPVVRRISGGGTVFHDLGNLNFSFIKNGKREELINFRKYTEPIVGALDELGVKAVFGGKNDLRINELKISGNAEHIHRNRVLHHGTLLFSSDLSYLNEAIKVKEDGFKDKAVKSNRSIVTNILDHLPEKVSLAEFRKRILNFVQQQFEQTSIYTFSEKDIAAINQLAQEKYKTWKWNYGYSPKYQLEREIAFASDNLKIILAVKDGLIEKINLNGLSNPEHGLKSIADKLEGIPHSKEEISKVLNQYKNEKIFREIMMEELINGMF